MTGHVKVSGAFKTLVSGTAVKVGGAWKNVSFGYVKVSGAWKQFFQDVVVTLSGEIITAGEDGETDTSTAQLEINQNGNVFKSVNTTRSQIDSDTDWIRPDSAAPGAYQVRYTALTGDPLDGGSTAAEDVWFALSDGDYFLKQVQSGAGSKSSTFDVQIREGTGPVITQAEYELSPNVVL